MKIIAITSQKGGAGKTTLTAHLSVMATVNGKSSAIVDTDPQGSLTDWHKSRTEEMPYLLPLTIDDLISKRGEIASAGIDYLFIDTPPAITDLVEKVMAIADLILIPTQPSPLDLRAVASTIRLAKDTDKKIVFIVNRAKPRTRITNEAVFELSQHGTVAPVIIHDRLDLSTCMATGQIAGEGKSLDEIQVLWKYIEGRTQ